MQENNRFFLWYIMFDMPIWAESGQNYEASQVSFQCLHSWFIFLFVALLLCSPLRNPELLFLSLAPEIKDIMTPT